MLQCLHYIITGFWFSSFTGITSYVSKPEACCNTFFSVFDVCLEKLFRALGCVWSCHVSYYRGRNTYATRAYGALQFIQTGIRDQE